MQGLKINNPGATNTFDVAIMYRGERATVEVQANTMTDAGLLAEQKGYALIPAFPSNPLPYMDYGLNSYGNKPKHALVVAETRREIARVHHEEDLFMLLNACRDHRVMLNALREIVANDPHHQSSAGAIARHAIAAVEATATQS